MFTAIETKPAPAPSFEQMYQDLSGPFPAIVCQCGHCIFTHKGVIRSRCVKVAEGVALCRCKRWVKVPVTMAEDD